MQSCCVEVRGSGGIRGSTGVARCSMLLEEAQWVVEQFDILDSVGNKARWTLARCDILDSLSGVG